MTLDQLQKLMKDTPSLYHRPSVTLALKGGQTAAGILTALTDDTVFLRLSGGELKQFPRADVTSVALLAATTDAQPAPGELKWFTSFDQAQAEAEKSGKPILADFTGSDWCPWCMKLRQEVFDTKQFKEWAAKSVVLIEVDFPRNKPQDDATKKANQALAAKYGIRGYPTVVFLTADGKVLGQSGYQAGGPVAWTTNAQKILDAMKPAAN
jgi:protein disulfide-isomerase